MAAFSQEAISNSITSSQPFQAYCLPENSVAILEEKSSETMSPAEGMSVGGGMINKKNETLNLKAAFPVLSMSAKDDKAVRNCYSSINSVDADLKNESRSERASENSIALSTKEGYSSCHQKIDDSLCQAGTNVKAADASVTVPFGWRRTVLDGRVLYISPSECQLCSLQEVIVYLQAEGTCKCGLECPLIIGNVFNFNPSVLSRPWNVTDFSWNDATKLCNHKRKIIAMATFQNSTNPPTSVTPPQEALQPSVSRSDLQQKKDSCLSSRKKRGLKTKSRSPFDGVLVSQLLAQRDKLGLRRDKKDDLHHRASASNQLSEAPTPSLVHSDATFHQTSATDGAKQTVVECSSTSAMNTSVPNHVTGQIDSSGNWYTTEGEYKTSEAVTTVSDGAIAICNRTQQNTVQPTCPSVCGMSSMCIKQPSAANNFSSLESDLIHRNTNPNRLLYTKPIAALSNNTGPVNIRPCLQQQPYCPPQSLFSNNNIVTGSATVNCISGNSLNQTPTGHVFSSQLQINQCVGINGQLPSGMLSAMSQQICSTGIPFRTDTTSINQPISNVTNSNITLPSQVGMHGISSGCITSSQPLTVCETDTANSFASKQKIKKMTNKSKVGKFGCMLDRSSPCPNVDVRQIPSEHHRPPPEAIAAMTGVSSSLHPASTPIIQPLLSSGNNNLNFQHNYVSDPLYSINCPSSQVPSNIIGTAIQPCRTELTNNFIDSAKGTEVQHSGINTNSFVRNGSGQLWPRLSNHSPLPLQETVNQQVKGQGFSFPSCTTTCTKPCATTLPNYNNTAISVSGTNTVQTSSSNLTVNRSFTIAANCENQNSFTQRSNSSVSGADNMTLMNTSTCTVASGNNTFQLKSPTQDCSKGSSSTPLLNTFGNSTGLSSQPTSMSSVILPVTSNYIIFTSSVNVQNPCVCPSVTSVNQNMLGFPITSVASQTGHGATGPLPSGSVMACFQQPRPGLTLSAQQSLLYNNTTNNSGSNHSSCTPTNLFMPATTLPGIDGSTAPLRPSILQLCLFGDF